MARGVVSVVVLDLIETVELGVTTELVGTSIVRAVDSKGEKGMLTGFASRAVLFRKVPLEIITLKENGACGVRTDGLEKDWRRTVVKEPE